MTHTRINHLPFQWPATPLHVVLVTPEIPPNTGNIARLCAATGTRLHLVGPLGFHLTDKAMLRAGLDYWDEVDLVRHPGYESFENATPHATRYYFSTRGERNYTDITYQPGDMFVFGCETAGLSDAILDANPGHIVGIPMRGDRVRSLNLANAVAIVIYEALRQINRR